MFTFSTALLFFYTLLSSSPSALALIGKDAQWGGPSASCKLSYVDQDGTFVSYCSGTLVEKNIVLTSAHCVQGIALETMRIQCGFAEEQPIITHESSTRADISFKEQHLVQNVELHPDYNNQTLDFDLAQVKLKTISTITPAHLFLYNEPLNPNSLQTFDQCIINGFGRHGDSLGHLYHAPLDLKDLTINSQGAVELQQFIFSEVDVHPNYVETLRRYIQEKNLNRDFINSLSDWNPDNISSATLMGGDSGSGLLCREFSGPWRTIGVASYIQPSLTLNGTISIINNFILMDHKKARTPFW
ncbi:MAG: trypsin-like serine protease [Bdellovibrionaceae bacterium]|nr:trypsin-like serine protease [Pseudobdellovibrionaceae bacterium]